MARVIRVAAVQFEHTAGDKKANFGKIDFFLKKAASSKVDLVVFPECCITGYWFLRKLSKEELKELAEPVFGGVSSHALQMRSKETGMIIGAGLVEVAEGGVMYNTYVVAFPDGRLYSHRKLHCFISKHLSSGSEYTVFTTPLGLKAGVLICYDCNIGENVRITALKGAQLLLAPHQTGGCRSVNPHTMGVIERSLWDNREKDRKTIENELKGPKGRGWLMRWLPARAHDNGMFLVFSNGIGVDDDEIRTGNAMILDPYGRTVAETWKADDDMVVADLDFSLLEENTGQRWIRTRRPELYGMLSSSTGLEEDTRSVRFDERGV
jgi:predicted amidohydrolase